MLATLLMPESFILKEGSSVPRCWRKGCVGDQYSPGTFRLWVSTRVRSARHLGGSDRGGVVAAAVSLWSDQEPGSDPAPGALSSQRSEGGEAEGACLLSFRWLPA